MDKKNLYYIIEKGTNIRTQMPDNEYFIGNLNTAQLKNIKLNEIFVDYKNKIMEHEIISVEEYEKKFDDYKIETKQNLECECIVKVFIYDNKPDINKIESDRNGINFSIYYKDFIIAALSGLSTKIAHIYREDNYSNQVVNYKNRDNEEILITIKILPTTCSYFNYKR